MITYRAQQFTDGGRARERASLRAAVLSRACEPVTVVELIGKAIQWFLLVYSLQFTACLTEVVDTTKLVRKGLEVFEELAGKVGDNKNRRFLSSIWTVELSMFLC